MVVVRGQLDVREVLFSALEYSAQTGEWSGSIRTDRQSDRQAFHGKRKDIVSVIFMLRYGTENGMHG